MRFRVHHIFNRDSATPLCNQIEWGQSYVHWHRQCKKCVKIHIKNSIERKEEK